MTTKTTVAATRRACLAVVLPLLLAPAASRPQAPAPPARSHEAMLVAVPAVRTVGDVPMRVQAAFEQTLATEVRKLDGVGAIGAGEIGDVVSMEAEGRMRGCTQDEACLLEVAQGLGVAELIELGRRVELELARTTELKLFFDYPLAFRPLSRLADGAAGGRCGILTILGVLASGEYALCGIGMQVRELTFGIAGQDALAGLWRDAAVLRELRAGMPARLTGVCADCIMRARCLGTCVAQSYYRTQSLWSPFWFCEQAGATGQFPPSRMALPAGSVKS